jgi:hypothetical protein
MIVFATEQVAIVDYIYSNTYSIICVLISGTKSLSMSVDLDQRMKKKKRPLSILFLLVTVTDDRYMSVT